MKYIEEKIDRKKHFEVVGNFQCGADDPLDRFLTDCSFQYDEKRLGITYLFFEEEDHTLLAFYTIKTNAIQTFDTDTKEYNALPMIEIARIAVAHEFQASGIGKMLFFEYILPKVKIISSLVAVYGLIVFVEKYNINGIKFYKSLGFQKADNSVQNTISETFNEECDLYVLKLI